MAATCNATAPPASVGQCHHSCCSPIVWAVRLSPYHTCVYTRPISICCSFAQPRSLLASPPNRCVNVHHFLLLGLAAMRPTLCDCEFRCLVIFVRVLFVRQYLSLQVITPFQCVQKCQHALSHFLAECVGPSGPSFTAKGPRCNHIPNRWPQS